MRLNRFILSIVKVSCAHLNFLVVVVPIKIKSERDKANVPITTKASTSFCHTIQKLKNLKISTEISSITVHLVPERVHLYPTAMTRNVSSVMK
jgi:hypothetical protein